MEHCSLTSNLKGQTEMKTVKNIKKKLEDNYAIIAKSDKGNSTVIITIDEYNQKLNDFIENNNFNSTRSEPTNKFQTKVREIIRKSTHLIQQSQKWQYINLNPTAPTHHKRTDKNS
jgi:hypothetical protein